MHTVYFGVNTTGLTWWRLDSALTRILSQSYGPLSRCLTTQISCLVITSSTAAHGFVVEQHFVLTCQVSHVANTEHQEARRIASLRWQRGGKLVL